MNSLFYLHWDEQELADRIKPLTDLGFQIHSHWSAGETPGWVDTLPDIFVISLDRLPSHGRQYASWLWEAKKRHHIPVIFVDDKPDKIEQTREKFPAAVYCRTQELVTTIKKVLKNEK